MDKDAYCQDLSRYIHLNPVRAGIADRASEYPWSSYGYYIGVKRRPQWLIIERVLEYFDKDVKEASKYYRRFVEEVLGEKMSSPLKDVFASSFLGSEEFINWAKEKWIGFKNADVRNIPVLKKLKGTPSLEQINQTVGSIINRKDPLYKKFCLYIGQRNGGYRLKDIGAYYNMRGSAVSQSNRRFKEKIDRAKNLKKRLKEILNVLNVET